jgi:membrane protein implicated in regulation of membrane protease activity
MTDTISWIATAATIIAALMTASNLGARITGLGFAVFLIGSLCWAATGLMTGQPALTWTNGVLTLLNLFGMWRWLGRQVRVEEGATAAAEASEGTPGEALFPVSLLTRGPVECGGKHIGASVDAMAGRQSGRLAYVVVSEGGVAGVGETLRRLPWERTAVEADRLVARLSSQEFDGLDVLTKDDWPSSR